jgi:hypothetical protein
MTPNSRRRGGPTHTALATRTSHASPRPSAETDGASVLPRVVPSRVRRSRDQAFLTDPRFSDPFDPPGAAAPPLAPCVPAPPPKTLPPPQVDAETVIVPRVMSFDANGDGRVAAAELPDRMQDLVTRGDRNGDAALDREEIRAMASSSVVVGEGKGMPPRRTREIRITLRTSSDPGLGGLIEDLELPTDRRAQAFAAVAQAEADITSTVMASIDPLRGQVRALVTEGQFAALDGTIQSHGNAIRASSRRDRRAGWPPDVSDSDPRRRSCGARARADRRRAAGRERRLRPASGTHAPARDGSVWRPAQAGSRADRRGTGGFRGIAQATQRDPGGCRTATALSASAARRPDETSVVELARQP